MPSLWVEFGRRFINFYSANAHDTHKTQLAVSKTRCKFGAVDVGIVPRSYKLSRVSEDCEINLLTYKALGDRTRTQVQIIVFLIMVQFKFGFGYVEFFAGIQCVPPSARRDTRDSGEGIS